MIVLSILNIAVLMVRAGGSVVKPMLIAFDRFGSSRVSSFFDPSACCKNARFARSTLNFHSTLVFRKVAKWHIVEKRGADLWISDSSALSRTPAQAAGPWNQGSYVARCACLLPTYAGTKLYCLVTEAHVSAWPSQCRSILYACLHIVDLDISFSLCKS